jgi:alpha-beta hydrolase superfamily lysophospholipase
VCQAAYAWRPGPGYAPWPHRARAALVVLVPGMGDLRASYRFLAAALKGGGLPGRLH